MTDRLPAYLELADRMCLASEDVMAKASERPVGAPNTRNDMLGALALKIDGTFRALVEDCRAMRAEAMHHLKTMTEAFIYFYVVANDPTQRTAEQILADRLAKEHLKRFQHMERLRLIEGDAADIRTWTELRDGLRQEADQLANLATLAKKHSEVLEGWYGSVYRLACQSSHIGDLLLWMPDEQRIRVGPKEARAQATIAIHYGLHIALNLLDSINQSNDIGLHTPTEDLKATISTCQRIEPTARKSTPATSRRRHSSARWRKYSTVPCDAVGGARPARFSA